MRNFILVLSIMLTGCGAAAIPDDHITRLTEELQPVIENYRFICQAGRGCLEASGQDTADFVKACEEGWRLFQKIEAYQTVYCEMRGLECSEISSK